MKNQLSFLPQNMCAQIATDKLLEVNHLSEKYGLVLSQQDAALLIKKREVVLQSYGRVELGASMLSKLIKEFCDSPFLVQEHYEEVLEELMETFYYLKNESLDQISDDELLSAMHNYFDGPCGGSITLLQDMSLEKLARRVRFGEGILDEDEVELGDDLDEY